MLDAVPADGRPDQDELIVELVKNCTEQKPQLVEAIQANVDRERVVTSLMKLFERLEMILGEYELRCKEPGNIIPKRKFSNFSDDGDEHEEDSTESYEEEEEPNTQPPAPQPFPSNPFLLPSPPVSPTFGWPSQPTSQPYYYGGIPTATPIPGTDFNPFAPQTIIATPILDKKDDDSNRLQIDFLASLGKSSGQPAHTDPFLDWLLSPDPKQK